MRNIEHVRKLLSEEKTKLNLVDVYKDKKPPEEMISDGKFWPWVQEIETLLDENEGLNVEHVRKIVNTNLPNSINECKSLLESELEGYGKHELYQTRISPNISEFAIGATFYQGTNVQIGITFMDERHIRDRKDANKDITTGFYIDSATTILACIKGAAKIGCWTLDEKVDPQNIPEKFAGQYLESDIKQGETFTVEGGKSGITFVSADECAAFVIVQLIKDKCPVRLQFDSKAYNLLGVVASDQETSRFQVATVALRALSGSTDTEILKPYTKHSNSYIRWHCAREIYLRDSAAAKPIFEQLQQDVSPMISASATKCLQELYGE